MDKKLKILVATDFSKNSDDAIRTAWEWAQKLETGLAVVNVADISSGFGMSPFDHPSLTNFEDVLRKEFGDTLDKQIKKICPNDFEKIERQILFGPVVETLLDKIETENIELAVLGTKGHSKFEHLYMGSITEKMAQLSPVPVLAVKDDKVHTPDTLLVALDLNYDARELFWAKKIAKTFNSKIHLAHVVSPEISDNDFIQQEIERSKVQCIEDILDLGEKLAKEELELASKELQKEQIDSSWSVAKTDSSSPAKSLLKLIEENPTDLLVIGTHGRSGITKWLMGSVAESLIRKAPTSMLIMKNLF